MPVVFVTQIGTRFNVNDRFFERLQKATITTEHVATVDGRPKREKVEEPVSAEIQTALRSLSGKSFASAKEFLKATSEVITEDNKANAVESALIDSARSDNLYWIAVLLISLAAGGHQAWSANVFTLVSDVFPKKATASVTGIGGMVVRAVGPAGGLLPRQGAFRERPFGLLLRVPDCRLPIPGLSGRGPSADAEDDPAGREPPACDDIDRLYRRPSYRYWKVRVPRPL